MQRKPQNENTDGTGSHPANNEKQDEYFIFGRREEKHDRALVRLQKTFGSDDFSAYAANRIGVDTHVLKELVALGLARCFEGRYDLHFRSGYLTGVFEIPVRCFKMDSDFMNRYQSAPLQPPIESKAHQESVKMFFAGKLPAASSKRPEDWESMNVFKRFRWPLGIYLLLSSRYRNLSAYIRFLVYSDLGMEKKAERERARMGLRV